jgi:hypothetical protein
MKSLGTEHALAPFHRPVFPPLVVVVNEENPTFVGLNKVIQPVQNLGYVFLVPDAQIAHHTLDRVENDEARLDRLYVRLECSSLLISREGETIPIEAVDFGVRLGKRHFETNLPETNRGTYHQDPCHGGYD